jgi:hypothetical protein
VTGGIKVDTVRRKRGRVVFVDARSWLSRVDRASFTALTVMFTVSVSLCAPPAGVAQVAGRDLHRCGAVVVRGARMPLPPGAALMLAMVPVNVIVASAVPSPT